MCQGVPRTVLETAPGRLRVEVDGAPRWMKAAEHLVAAVEPGSYVLVYAGVGAAGLTITIALLAAATAPGRSSATTQTSNTNSTVLLSIVYNNSKAARAPAAVPNRRS